MPKLVRMLISRGSPVDGTVIRAGAVVELPDFWAERFIADGSCIEEQTASAERASQTRSEAEPEPTDQPKAPARQARKRK